MDKPIVIDTPLGIRLFQLTAQIGALKLEMRGLKRRGRSVYAIVKEHYGFKGSRQGVLAQLVELRDSLVPITVVDGVGFRNGELTINGQAVGRADHDLKFGYHPAVHVTVGKNQTWFEMDEENLKQLVADFVHQYYPKDSPDAAKPDVHCDICKEQALPIYIDGKTKMGPWGNMCVKCWPKFGVNRLGTGYGQQYEWQTSKYEKIAG